MLSIIIIDTWRWTPFIILIVLAGIVSLDVEMQEAARIDGANWWQVFLHVQFPLLMPVILAAFIVRWLGAIKMFDIIFASTRGGPGSSTEVINLFIYETAFRSLAFDRSAAMAMITVVGALFLTFGFVRITNALERRL
jgi:multiple sugar transport system permease protein